MFEEATNDYINFIRTFLVTQCYQEYYRMVFNAEKEDDNYGLLEQKNDPLVWNQIMLKMKTILQYYLELTETKEWHVQYSQANVFPKQTFQEYIDSIVNLKTMGSYDYQQFILHMQNPDFKAKMIKKYNRQQLLHALQNNVIYMVQLYLIDYTRSVNTYYFSEEELADRNMYLDLTPYYLYLHAKKPEPGNMTEQKQAMLEEKTLDIIKTVLSSF
jgi:hypothetical protein